MKFIFVMADGRCVVPNAGEPNPYAAWLERGGVFFRGVESYSKEKPYNGTLVYVQVPEDVYRDAKKRRRAERVTYRAPANRVER